MGRKVVEEQGRKEESEKGSSRDREILALENLQADSISKDQPVSPTPPLPNSLSPHGLSPTAITIGFVSLLSDISGEMIYPVLPLFLTEVLHAPATAIGLVEGIAVGVTTAIGGISGWLSDRVGRRKPIAFAGYALTALTRPVIAAAQTWPIVLVARFAERFGKAVRNAPRDALIADSTPLKYRGRAFGFERAMDSAGAVLGPLVALVLLEWLAVEMRYIFLISAIPALMAALLILMVRERPGPTAKNSTSIHLSFRGATSEYKKLLLVTAVFGLANSANAFLILRAENLGLSTKWTILAYAFYNLVAALFSMPAGAASDRFGRRNLLILGYSIYAISYVGFAAASAAWMVWPLFALYGLFPALTDGVAKAMAVDTAGRAGRATAIGIYSMVAGITQTAASYAGGVLWDKVSAQATFYAGAAMAALAVVLLFILFPPRLPSRKLDSPAN